MRVLLKARGGAQYDDEGAGGEMYTSKKRGGCMFRQFSGIIGWLSMLFLSGYTNPCSYPLAKSIAQTVVQSPAVRGTLHAIATISGSAAAGYVIGSCLPQKVTQLPPSLTKVFIAAYLSAISAGTIAPYVAYKKGSISGLCAYGMVIAGIMLRDYYKTNARRHAFAQSQAKHNLAYLTAQVADGSPETLLALQHETCPHELYYRLAKNLLAEHLGR